LAQTLSILCKKNTVQIIVDGNEMHDVLYYNLEEGSSIAVLTLKVAVTGEIEVQL